MSHASTTKTYLWNAEGERHQLNLVWVPGTNGEPYRFGHESAGKPIDVAGFFIAATPVTQALWTHVMGHNPSVKPGPRRPVENVSWGDITGPRAFLDRRTNGSCLLLLTTIRNFTSGFQQKPNGSMRRAVDRPGAITSPSAETMIRIRLPGTDRVGLRRVRLWCGCSDGV